MRHQLNRPYIFQLTTSRGDRLCRSVFIHIYIEFFNSRPLGEVDFYRVLRERRVCFSTHDLSGRSTFALQVSITASDFSTHDLSGRSTYPPNEYIYLFFFQLTTSRGGRRECNEAKAYDVIFQLTTSRGGRPQNFTINH